MVRRIVKNISISRHLLQFLESGWGGGGMRRGRYRAKFLEFFR